jgi:hypothetical protein
MLQACRDFAPGLATGAVDRELPATIRCYHDEEKPRVSAEWPRHPNVKRSSD